MLKIALAAAVLPLTLLSGCASAGPAATHAAQSETPSAIPAPEVLTAAELAAQLDVPSITAMTDLTEDTDINELLGRPNGYTSATVITDTAGTCPSDGPGVNCGATIEVFATPELAQRRADYIVGIYADNPVLGSEYDYLNGTALLRVSGSLKPSVAEQYNTSFGGTLQQP